MAALNWVAGALFVVVMLGVCIKVYGAYAWNGATRVLYSRLESARRPMSPRVFDAKEIESLPAPVQRYFRAALTDGQAMVAAVELEHAGTFNMGEANDQWKPFTSRQQVVTNRPGFVWNGRIAMFPGVPVFVHDAYVAEEGILRPSVLGVFLLADMHGTKDMAEGELMRFFAETAWYPTALLPSQGVTWEALDDHSARAVLVDGATRAVMTFRFGDDDLIDTVHASARGRTVAGRIEMTAWQGRFWNYQKRDGMMIPLNGEVSWLLPQGPKPYWRGLMTSLAYEFAK